MRSLAHRRAVWRRRGYPRSYIYFYNAFFFFSLSLSGFHFLNNRLVAGEYNNNIIYIRVDRRGGPRNLSSPVARRRHNNNKRRRVYFLVLAPPARVYIRGPLVLCSYYYYCTCKETREIREFVCVRVRVGCKANHHIFNNYIHIYIYIPPHWLWLTSGSRVLYPI